MRVERVIIESGDGLNLLLYKVGKIVICTGSYIAKNKYTYNKTIPVSFRPKINTFITAQYVGYIDGISTTTIHILQDGIIKTYDSYKNFLSTGSAVWEIN